MKLHPWSMPCFHTKVLTGVVAPDDGGDEGEEFQVLIAIIVYLNKQLYNASKHSLRYASLNQVHTFHCEQEVVQLLL